MVTAYLFDRRKGKEIEASWLESFQGIGKNEVLWLDLVEPSEDEGREVCDALGLNDLVSSGLADQDTKTGLEQREGYLRVTAVAVSDEEQDPSRERVVVDCYVGVNWVMTVHDAAIAALDDFREIAEGEGEIGILNARVARQSSQSSYRWLASKPTSHFRRGGLVTNAAHGNPREYQVMLFGSVELKRLHRACSLIWLDTDRRLPGRGPSLRLQVRGRRFRFAVSPHAIRADTFPSHTKPERRS